jgi:hypothetical protein
MSAAARRSLIVAVAVLAMGVMAALAAMALTADEVPAVEEASTVVDQVPAAEDPAVDLHRRAPEPRYDCREIEGREICDTFDESYEGPGTDVDFTPAEPGRTEPGYDCREVEGREICDTFDEADEGPGTYDDSDEGPGTR